MHRYVHRNITYNRQNMEAIQVSTNRQMDEEDVGHIYNRILLSNKKSEILPFATTWMDLKGTMLSEINHTVDKSYCMILLICRIYKDKNEQTKQKRNRPIGIKNKLMVAKGEESGKRWAEKEFK